MLALIGPAPMGPASDVKTGPLAKLGSLVPLWNEYQAYLSAHGSGEGFKPSDRSFHMSGDGVLIEAFASGAISPKTLATKLTSRQLRGARRFANGVTGVLPLGSFQSAAALAEMSYARPVRAITRAGSVNSQGDPAVRGDIARSSYGMTGSGVKVGVLSDSFDAGSVTPGSYAGDVSSGDLPSGVQIIEDYTLSDAIDEGRAMAQLVYDTAPGTSLAFATAFTGQSGFADNIMALRDAGAKVIVDDVIYFDEPMFQDGVIAQAVDNVVSTGSAYFSSAGNEARQGYESAFRSGTTRAAGSISGSGSLTFYGGLTHDFDSGAGSDDMQQVTLPAGGILVLSFQWDQPYGTVPTSAASCANDMDVYVLNSAGTAVLAAGNTSNIGNDPIEIVDYENTGGSTQTLQIMIVRRSGSSPGLMKYVDIYGDATITQFATGSGTVWGHNSASGAAAVGAAAWNDTPAYGVTPPVIEDFSSAGRPAILFDKFGTLLGSPEVRQRPQFVAPDGGNTTFFYSDSPDDADSTPNFYGTSAAAPAAAAVAALMLQASPSLTPAQIITQLQNSALDMDDPFTVGFDAGYDDGTGFGLIRADLAVAAVLGPPGIAGQVFEDRDADGTFDAGEPTINGVTLFLDTNNNTVLDGGESSTLTGGAGNYSFPSLVAATYHLRQITPGGYIVTTPAGGATDVTIVAGTTTRNFGDFPIVYAGTAAGDNYELRMGAASPVAYSDNFNRATLAGGSFVYTTAATAGDGGASITGNDILTLTNDATTAANASGVVYATTPVSAFSGFNPKLNLNGATLTWSFNMQQIRSNPGGLTAGSYGAAYVLASSGSALNSGTTGYAVAVGESGAGDPIRLVRFSNGLAATTSILDNGTAVGTGYYSVKVTYNPSNNQWTLATRNDGTAFADPLAGAGYGFTSSPAADSTYTSTTMTHAGAYWAYSTTTAQTAKFDNTSLTIGGGGGSPTNVEVLIGGVVTYTAPKASLPSLKFNLGSGDDSLIINHTNGDPLPTGGVFYDGQAGANDTITIAGSAGADMIALANAFAGPTAGSINLNDASTGAQTVEAITFNGGVGSDNLVVSSAPIAPIVFNGGTTVTDIDRLTLNAGSHTFNSDLGALTANAELVLNGAATSATLNASQHLSLLSYNTGQVTLAPNGSRVINTDLLFVGATAKLDLTDNDMIVRSGVLGGWNGSAYVGITGLVAKGQAGGAWTGNGIVTSQTAATAPRARTTLGVALASDALNILSSATAPWGSETVTGNSVLVKYTYIGDANLSGDITGDDYFMIDNGFPSAKAYVSGDFNYSGLIDADDYFWIDSTYASQDSPL